MPILRFDREGTDLVAFAAIPPSINGGREQHYQLRVSLNGSEIAVEALAQHLQRAMEERLRQIRREAYIAGARDRARKATSFAGDWDVGESRNHHGGCYQ